jgi:hypothetical protein
MNGMLHVAAGTRVAPLGLRFWDLTTRNFVADDLAVTAFPAGHPRLRVQAAVTRSGVWVFHHLPGLEGFERALTAGTSKPVVVDDAFWSDPELGGDKGQFVVQVQDTRSQQRFLPLELQIQAPVQGVFSWPVPGGIGFPAGPAGAIPLFSGPTRPTSAGMAMIRMDLHTPPAGLGGEARPAAWSLVRAALGATTLAWGLSDTMGRVALMFPHPSAPSGVGTPPPLPARTWDVTLTAWYKTPAPGSDIPPRGTLPAVLQQTQKVLYKKWGLVPADRVILGAIKLHYGEELIVKSDGGKGRLWVA